MNHDFFGSLLDLDFSIFTITKSQVGRDYSRHIAVEEFPLLEILNPPGNLEA